MDSNSRSPFDGVSDENPFASPLTTTSASYVPLRREGDKTPTFPKVMAVLDLLFFVIRVGAVLFVLATRGSDFEVLESADALVWIELASGVLLTAFSAVAAIGILLHAAKAIVYGWITAGCTLISISAGVLQFLFFASEFGEDTMQASPFIVAAVGVEFVRLCLLVLYTKALVQYAAWLRHRDAALTPP